MEILPVLETERLLLRPLANEDLEFIFSHFSNPLVTEYLMDEPPLENREQAQHIIDFYNRPGEKNNSRWALVLKENQQVIGTIGFHRWEKPYFRSEMGYDLTPAYWGYGLMSEAIQAMLRFGFEQMGLNRIDALVYVDNPRSVNVLKKAGFQIEGCLRDYFCLNGVFYDHYYLSLLRRDWINNKPGN